MAATSAPASSSATTAANGLVSGSLGGNWSAKTGANPNAYDRIIEDMGAKYGVDPRLVKSVIQAESHFNPNAKSHAGAQGLMQLEPGTFRDMGGGNITDPRTNIEAGTKYLSQMLERFHGDTSLALAAYNAGPGNVHKYGGIPPFAETKKYVRDVLAKLQGQ